MNIMRYSNPHNRKITIRKGIVKCPKRTCHKCIKKEGER